MEIDLLNVSAQYPVCKLLSLKFHWPSTSTTWLSFTVPYVFLLLKGILINKTYFYTCRYDKMIGWLLASWLQAWQRELFALLWPSASWSATPVRCYSYRRRVANNTSILILLKVLTVHWFIVLHRLSERLVLTLRLETAHFMTILRAVFAIKLKWSSLKQPKQSLSWAMSQPGSWLLQ